VCIFIFWYDSNQLLQTNNVFLEYFENGLSPSEAKHLHENKLLVQENSCTLLANANINPTMRHVYYLHDEWRKDNFGPVHEPLPKLQEKIVAYNEKGKYIKQEHTKKI